jgi:carboxypeptidase family protein
MQSAPRPVVIRILLATFALAFLLGSSTFMAAQDVASLTGVVTDASGAVVPGVNVKLVDTRTSATSQATTNSVGAYAFHDLLPGPGYQLTFSKQGFDSIAVPNLYLAVNTTHTQNAELKIGKSSETVEVRGESSAVSLDTSDATVGNSFDMNLVHELPVQIRDNPAALMRLQPGVISAQGSNDDPNQSRDGATAGSRTDQGNVTLDGLDINDFAGGFAFTTVANAPVDSVQEFRGEVANPLSAEGRGSGAQINLVTKSGSNQFHGAAYEYNRNASFEANNFFNNFANPKVPREQLVRNQFGADLGGPIWKDKLFFFFNYEGRRDAHQASNSQTVPLDSFRAGNVSYINSAGSVTTLNPTQVAALDPQGIGWSPTLLAFINQRYPHSNSTALGDGINTGGYVYNAPSNETLNDYVARVDANITSKMKIFLRGSLQRETDDGFVGTPSIQFAGDPLTKAVINHSYAYVFGHTWTISPTKINQFIYGETRQELSFQTLYNPVGVNQYEIFDNNGENNNLLSAPYESGSTQGRVVPIPIFRDDFTWVHGKHTIQVGGTFKPIKTTDKLLNDFNDSSIGLGGGLTSLTSNLRPADLQATNAAQLNWDSAFTFALGRFGFVDSAFNYDAQLNALPQGTGHTRQYRYYETETYLQDSWKTTPNLTVTYGLRYQYYSVPFEVNGLESVPNVGYDQVMDPRLVAGQIGGSGADNFFVAPVVSYALGGKENHGPGLYHPDWHDFAPKVSFSYSPGSKDGLLGRILGDRKTVIRGGAGIIFDHPVTNALNFLQDQYTYVFENSTATNYGFGESATQALANDPRFTPVGTVPAGSVAPAPTVTLPYSPFTTNGVPTGELTGAGLFNYAIDPHLKVPYSEMISFGVQRELPAHFMLEATYIGRFAHRLLAQADAGQVVDFKDTTPGSGQFLAAAFGNLSQQVRQSPNPVTPQPFFENQMTAATERNYGTDCPGVSLLFGFPTPEPNCSQLVADVLSGLVFRGDLGDTVQALGGAGILPAGVGLAPQFGTQLYITNKGYSNYNGLLVQLHKRLSQGLQFDVNYTWSHSLDNISAPANQAFGSNGAGGIMCDSVSISVCYGNSDFDVTHVITADALFQLPVGRGKAFASNIPRWADEVIGGWQISGLATWQTGLAFQTVANAYPISFANNVPAVFNGDTSAISTNPHVAINPTSGNPQIQLFSNPDSAVGAFSFPTGLEAGSRNNLRGPHFFDVDLGVAKHFRVTEGVAIELRGDAFNVFNHTNLGLPGTDATADISSPFTQGGNFGVITTTANDARVLQVAFRVDF